MSDSKGWIGVDLDGTLAVYAGWQPDGGVGAPVPAMVERVKRWLAEGQDIRIMTARACENDLTGADGRLMQLQIIGDWCEKHLGQRLPITATKDYQMIALWDDRAVQVVPNTGFPLTAGGPFICGNAGIKDSMGLPDKLMVCPEFGLDGFAVYTKTRDYSAPGY